MRLKRLHVRPCCLCRLVVSFYAIAAMVILLSLSVSLESFNIPANNWVCLFIAGGEPDHHCMVPTGQTREETIPLELKEKKWRFSQCSRYVNLSVSNETTSCDQGWYYDKSEFRSTIVSDVSILVSSRLTNNIYLYFAIQAASTGNNEHTQK